MSPSGMPEFSRPMLVRTLREASADAPREILFTATEAECARIATRLQIPGVASLTCRYELHSEVGHTVLARGALTAKLSQLCALTLDVFEDVIGERFTIRFVPEARFEENKALDPVGELDEIDEIPYAGDSIDLGEATVEQLSLILDPYPRRPGVARPAGVLTESDVDLLEDEAAAEEKTNPFAALARLRGGGK
ncbi:YceD family protein [Acetobacter conturbans]|uniref:DUF177 domain-containing protein n=1 Tax=Acetobacter conturbans TaxID=1737472 RepID=A0ABX0K730_9PROT|nr:DUF177 domain-containing protein [Acetobacter conturbans]NHN89737.1 DUF177 domain-containing protein [Acetobacter conturbans]